MTNVFSSVYFIVMVWLGYHSAVGHFYSSLGFKDQVQIRRIMRQTGYKRTRQGYVKQTIYWKDGVIHKDIKILNAYVRTGI